MRVKVKGALASTILSVDLRVKVKRALASTFLRGEADLRVKELRSSWWTRARQHRNKLLKSGHGTSRSSSRGGGEGKSWRGVVEVAVEVRLNNLVTFQAPYIPQEVGRVTLRLLPRVVVKRVKSLWES